MRKFWQIVVLLLVILTSNAQSKKYVIENNELKTGMPIVFKAGNDALDPSSDSALYEVYNYLTDKTYITLLRIEAHVANTGNEVKNLTLSIKRSIAIAKWLILHGIEPSRLIAVAFGDTKPLVDKKSSDGESLNTRIHFVNAALRNRPIGGLPVDGGGQVACGPCSL